MENSRSVTSVCNRPLQTLRTENCPCSGMPVYVDFQCKTHEIMDRRALQNTVYKDIDPLREIAWLVAAKTKRRICT
jgi:hypothetical protein